MGRRIILNPLTGKFDYDSGFIGQTLALFENPTNTQELGAYLNSYLRVFIQDPSLVTNVYVDSATGNDENTGLSGSPWQTLQRAKQFLASENGANINVNLAGAGPYVWPPMTTNLNWVTILGTATIEESRTASGSSATAGKEVAFTVSGAALTDNAWRGRLVSVTGVLGNARGINITENIGNAVKGCMYNRTFTSDIQTSPGTGTINLLSLTELQFSTSTGFVGCFQLNFRNIKATGSTSTIFCQATDKVEFRYCQMEVGNLNSGRAGGLYIISSCINNYGTANGVAQGRTRGDLRLGYSTIVTNKNSGAGLNFLQFLESANFTREGLVWLQGLDSTGIKFEGASAQIIASGTNITGHLWFDDHAATAAISSCQGTININPSTLATGFFYGFGQIKGKANTTYAVKATGASQTVIDASSSLVTTGGTNYVSADNGTTASARAYDDTRIFGGTPSAPAGYSATVLTATTPYAPDLRFYETVAVDSTAAPMVVTLPASASFANGTEITVVDYLYNAAANNIAINPTGADTVGGWASYPLNVNGQSRTFTLMGTDWVVTEAYL